MNFLDCTLRDGGYYNNWDFPLELTQDYLNAIQISGFNWVEIGFRSKIDSGFKGPFAYSSESFLSKLDVPEGVKLAVMVNASELLMNEGSLEKTIDSLFSKKSDSAISMVRIACHHEEFEDSLPAVKILSDKGYLVGMNLMQISQRTDSEIRDLAKKSNDWPIHVFYIADSLGSLSPERTSEIVDLISKEWIGDIGVHCHDNLGNAMQNSRAAISSGSTWIDSTVTGMGRGPGNLQSEYVVTELMTLRGNMSNLLPLLSLIDTYFSKLKTKYGWGRNALYSLSGSLSIHPTFIQEMISNPNYDNAQILSLLNRLGNGGGESFSRALIDEQIDNFCPPESTNWIPRLEINSREVLLIAPGPSIYKYESEIVNYISKSKPFVISLNLHRTIPESLIDARVISHPLRAATEMQGFCDGTTILSPLAKEQVDSMSRSESFRIFSSVVSRSGFSFHENHSMIPNSLAISYALGICGSGQTPRILMAGFDGFNSEDPRRRDVDHVLKLFTENTHSPQITSVTPTLYDIPITSIFLLNSENQ